MAEPQESPIPWNAEDRIACSFSFACPKRWDELELTSGSSIRHCSVCAQDVHLAHTEEEFRQYRTEGKCVAVQIVPSPGESQASEVFMVGNAEEAPYFPKARVDAKKNSGA